MRGRNAEINVRKESKAKVITLNIVRPQSDKEIMAQIFIMFIWLYL